MTTLCEVCKQFVPCGVFSTSAPYSCAVCRVCLNNGATDPINIFQIHKALGFTPETIRPDILEYQGVPAADLLKTYYKGSYITFRQWWEESEKEYMQTTRGQEWWDRWFLGLAKYYSTASKDPSTQVGAIIVNDLRIVVGHGYNGFPRGVADTAERLNNRTIKYQYVEHAERNAIFQAGAAARGSTLYVYPSFMMPPICNDCCKGAIQAGIKTIVGFKPDLNDERVKRWADSISISRMMCEEAGIGWREVELV